MVKKVTKNELTKRENEHDKRSWRNWFETVATKGLFVAPRQLKITGQHLRRNAKCMCKSGLKFKNCCSPRKLAHEQLDQQYEARGEVQKFLERCEQA